MGSICLGLLCGLPASGKSTLAIQIQDHVAQVLPTQLCVLVLHYDRLIPGQLEQELIAQTDEQGRSIWKLMRLQITACVDHLLSLLKHGQKAVTELVHVHENSDDLHTSCEHLPASDNQADYLVRPSNVDSSLWQRFVLLLQNSLKKMTSCKSGCESDSCSWLVLVDDNMHYSSMRYQYCQLARKHEASICIIHVTCPLEEALQRNQLRSEDRVEESVITIMHERLETPDRDKRPWEKYSAIVSGTSTIDLQPLLEMVQEALLNPQQLHLEENTEDKVISRYVCSTNAVHQADQILRRCVSLHMAEAKGAGLSSEELKTISAKMTKIRAAILSELRQGELTLPFHPNETDLPNASKNLDSALFQFVQAVFSARTKCSS